MKNFSYLLKISGCLLLMSGVLCFTSCKGDDPSDEIADVSAISGTVADFSSYASKIDSIYVIDQNGGNILTKSTIDASGKFKIQLPVPKSSILTSLGEDKPSTIAVSNPNTKGCVVTFVGFKNKVNTYNTIFYGTYNATDNTITYKLAMYLYADSPCTIKGSSSRQIFDLSLVKGWNKIGVTSVITMTSTSESMVMTYSNTLPSPAQWMIISEGN